MSTLTSLPNLLCRTAFVARMSLAIGRKCRDEDLAQTRHLRSTGSLSSCCFGCCTLHPMQMPSSTQCFSDPMGEGKFWHFTINPSNSLQHTLRLFSLSSSPPGHWAIYCECNTASCSGTRQQCTTYIHLVLTVLFLFVFFFLHSFVRSHSFGWDFN